jgi:peptidoglycan/xylan/chitin deacetylase (PgdA/CDA1 family)
MLDWEYTPPRGPYAKIQRRLVQRLMAAPTQVRPDRPVVTFTFDDFPKSALAGADIVEAAGGHAGFFACTSFLGKRNPVIGEMFDSATLQELTQRGHEVGAHGHAHLDCAKAGIRAVEKDIGENLVKLTEAGLETTVSSFAYPYGETTFSAKRWVADVFSAARGIASGVNAGAADRGQLKAVELLDTGWARKRAFEMLKTCIRSKGWLIYFTHDVSQTPSPYGVPHELIQELADMAINEGAVLAAPTLGAVLSGVID